MQVPKEEQETIVLYNEAEEEASIYSFNRSMLRRLEKYAQKHPEICRKGRQYADGAAEYLLHKKYLSVHFLEPEGKQQQAAAGRARMTGSKTEAMV